MNKKKRNEIISIVVVLLVCIVLYVFFMNKNIYTLNIPKVEDLSSISLESGKATKKITDAKTMEDMISLLNGNGRMTKEESVNDAPADVKKSIKVELNAKEDGSSVIYVYERKGVYYLEQPYNGIYEISEDEYNGLENIFSRV